MRPRLRAQRRQSEKLQDSRRSNPSTSERPDRGRTIQQNGRIAIPVVSACQTRARRRGCEKSRTRPSEMMPRAYLDPNPDPPKQNSRYTGMTSRLKRDGELFLYENKQFGVAKQSSKSFPDPEPALRTQPRFLKDSPRGIGCVHPNRRRNNCSAIRWEHTRRPRCVDEAARFHGFSALQSKPCHPFDWRHACCKDPLSSWVHSDSNRLCRRVSYICVVLIACRPGSFKSIGIQRRLLKLYSPLVSFTHNPVKRDVS
jgi:hypothetical protein